LKKLQITKFKLKGKNPKKKNLYIPAARCLAACCCSLACVLQYASAPCPVLALPLACSPRVGTWAVAAADSVPGCRLPRRPSATAGIPSAAQPSPPQRYATSPRRRPLSQLCSTGLPSSLMYGLENNEKRSIS